MGKPHQVVRERTPKKDGVWCMNETLNAVTLLAKHQPEFKVEGDYQVARFLTVQLHRACSSVPELHKCTPKENVVWCMRERLNAVALLVEG